jgi:hypothetical protein
VIAEGDIWRAAVLLIQQHGDNAEVVAADRAYEVLVRGDGGGHQVWLRIIRALAEMRAPPRGLLH